MTHPKHASILVAVSASLALTIAAAEANDVKISGRTTHILSSTDTQTLSDGRTVIRVHDKTIVEADDPNSPINRAWRDCQGTLVKNAKGDFVDGAGMCETIDKDNDMYWSTWNFAPTGAVWNAYHGNGKFEGITGTGTTSIIANFPDRYIAGFEGTLKLK